MNETRAASPTAAIEKTLQGTDSRERYSEIAQKQPGIQEIDPLSPADEVKSLSVTEQVSDSVVTSSEQLQENDGLQKPEQLQEVDEPQGAKQQEHVIDPMHPAGEAAAMLSGTAEQHEVQMNTVLSPEQRIDPMPAASEVRLQVAESQEQTHTNMIQERRIDPLPASMEGNAASETTKQTDEQPTTVEQPMVNPWFDMPSVQQKDMQALYDKLEQSRVAGNQKSASEQTDGATKAATPDKTKAQEVAKQPGNESKKVAEQFEKQPEKVAESPEQASVIYTPEMIEQAWKAREGEDKRLTEGEKQAKAADHPPAKEDYRYVYREGKDTPRLDREPSNNGPKLEYQKDTEKDEGKFASRTEQDAIKPVLGETEVRQLEEMPAGKQQKMQRDWNERERSRVAKNELEAIKEERELTPEEEQQLSTEWGNMTKASWLLGEHAADDYARNVLGAAKGDRLYPPPGEGYESRPGTCDQVWRIHDENGQEKLLVIEAKGGSGQSSTREIKNENGVLQRYEQGTPEYLADVIGEMRLSKDAKVKAVGEELNAARRNVESKLEYIKVHTELDNEKGLKYVGINLFVIDK